MIAEETLRARLPSSHLRAYIFNFSTPRAGFTAPYQISSSNGNGANVSSKQSV